MKESSTSDILKRMEIHLNDLKMMNHVLLYQLFRTHKDHQDYELIKGELFSVRKKRNKLEKLFDELRLSSKNNLSP